MLIAERLSNISPSQTLAMNNRAREMRAQGISVTSLAVGEPDFSTPDFIKKAAIQAIEDNFTKYTPAAGIPALREAAGNFFEIHYGAPVAPESIIIGAGGKQCLFTFILATIGPGDEVLIPSPYWVSYPDMVLLASGKPVFVPASQISGYKVTPELLEEKLTDKTKMLILNTPSNPTGAVYSERELTEIMDWAFLRNVFVLSDEIYDQLIYPPATMTSAISWFAKKPELVAVLNGLSKSYAMTGWRVGFLAAHPEIIKKMTVIQGHSLSNVCSIAQKAGLAALTGPQECVEEMRLVFEKRRDLAMAFINAWNRVSYPRPDGAFYLFVDVSGYYNVSLPDSTAFCSWLLEKAHVAAVPGIAFGDDRCMRLSFAVEEKELEKALEAIGAALRSRTA